MGCALNGKKTFRAHLLKFNKPVCEASRNLTFREGRMGMKRTGFFQSREISYYIMVIPALVWMLAINIVPMFGIVMAFQDFNPGKGILGSEFVGLENFRYMFQMKDVSQIFFNTIIIAVFKLVLNVLVPVIFALLLNEIKNVMFKRTVQTIVYLPHFV